MKVALFGGTGFVGNYIIYELLNADHEPHVLVRPQNASKLIQADKCTVYSGHIEKETVIQDMLANTNAVIYNIGLIRQFSKKGITFEKLHFEGVKRTIKLAETAGVKRFILMSANGAKMQGTLYQTTKYLGEQLLKNSTLDWTIFRPTLIFGDPRGTVEFCSQLKRNMLVLPIPAPLFYSGLFPQNAGSFSFNPVHVTDVAKCFVRTLEKETAIGKTFEIGGEQTITWKELIKTITSAYGKNKWTIPASVFPIKTLAKLLDRFAWFPVTADQLTMLMEGNTCSSNVFEEFDVKPIEFNSESLQYLNE